MNSTRYRRGFAYAADMAAYTRVMSEEHTNTGELATLKQNLANALRSDVTERQREMLTLYYGKGLTMRQIGSMLGVDKSTVSRTVKRGERRLKRCIRYGAAALLRED